jgi:NNP family nitrate/nitrite transporter-like MFS transporter
MAIGMGVCNAAVFKLMPQYVPQAVGGAAGWVGGLRAFGGFVIPPILGYFVRVRGNGGYATGFVTYLALALLLLGMAFILSRTVFKSPGHQHQH